MLPIFAALANDRYRTIVRLPRRPFRGVRQAARRGRDAGLGAAARVPVTRARIAADAAKAAAKAAVAVAAAVEVEVEVVVAVAVTAEVVVDPVAVAAAAVSVVDPGVVHHCQLPASKAGPVTIRVPVFRRAAGPVVQPAFTAATQSTVHPPAALVATNWRHTQRNLNGLWSVPSPKKKHFQSLTLLNGSFDSNCNF